MNIVHRWLGSRRLSSIGSVLLCCCRVSPSMRLEIVKRRANTKAAREIMWIFAYQHPVTMAKPERIGRTIPLWIHNNTPAPYLNGEDAREDETLYWNRLVFMVSGLCSGFHIIVGLMWAVLQLCRQVNTNKDKEIRQRHKRNGIGWKDRHTVRSYSPHVEAYICDQRRKDQFLVARCVHISIQQQLPPTSFSKF